MSYIYIVYIAHILVDPPPLSMVVKYRFSDNTEKNSECLSYHKFYFE